jgi:hypothetical protein
MKLSSFINLPIFFISFFIGVLFVYLTVDDTHNIKIFPSPENMDIIQYRDKSGKCFQSYFNEIKCPIDETLITKIPEQI